MTITTDTEGREDCPVITAHCKYYGYQCDSNGEVAICFCAHPGNPTDVEGNCTHTLCPLDSASAECCKECDGEGYTYEGGMSMNEEMNIRVPCGSCDAQGYVDLDYRLKR